MKSFQVDRKQSYKVPNMYELSQIYALRIQVCTNIHKGLDQSVNITITNVFARDKAAFDQGKTVAAAYQLKLYA